MQSFFVYLPFVSISMNTLGLTVTQRGVIQVRPASFLQHQVTLWHVTAAIEFVLVIFWLVKVVLK